MGDSEVFNGIIKSFNSANGYGFVECAETMQQYQRDVFLHKNEFVNSGLEVGAGCVFNVNLDERGQPRAVNVLGPDGKPGPGNHMSHMKGQDFGGKGFGKGKGMGGKITGGNLPQASGPMYGQIKSFNQEKGFGFIDSQQAFQLFQNTDVYLHYTEAISFRVGDFVWFECDTTTGRPRAKNLQLATAAAPLQMNNMMMGGGGGMNMGGGMGMNMGMGGGMMGGNGMGGGGMGKGKGKGKESFSEKKEYTGTVKSYNEAKGYGFIENDVVKQFFNRDVFLKQADFEQHGLTVGEEVSFTVTLMNGDQPQANILGKTASLAQAGQDKLSQLNMPLTGIVKSYNEAKGFGFIQSGEVMNVFGGDVFLHRNMLDNASNAVGQEVRFNVFINANGKPQANEITILGEPGSYDAGAGEEPAAKRQRLE